MKGVHSSKSYRSSRDRSKKGARKYTGNKPIKYDAVAVWPCACWEETLFVAIHSRPFSYMRHFSEEMDRMFEDAGWWRGVHGSKDRTGLPVWRLSNAPENFSFAPSYPA